MNKQRTIVAILTLIVLVETGYIIYDLFGKDLLSVSDFDEPANGLDVYNDLKNLGCTIVQGDDLWFRYDVRLETYEDFYEIARGRTVVLDRSLHERRQMVCCTRGR